MTRSRRACSRAPLVVLGATRVASFRLVFTFFTSQLAFISAEPSRFLTSLFHFQPGSQAHFATFLLQAHPTRDCCQKYTCRA